MRKLAAVAAVLAIIVMAPALFGSAAQEDHKNRLAAEERESGWKQIFDGKTLEGWGITGSKEGWAVEDGAIACTVKGGGMIYSTERFKDFILRCQFKTNPCVNSGIFLRWEDLKD